MTGFRIASPRRQRMKILTFLLLVGLASAQSTSVVEGTVGGASNAAVPEGKVTLTNQATQVAYRSTSNSLGVVRVAALPLGIYQVEIEAKGFKPWVETDL